MNLQLMGAETWLVCCSQFLADLVLILSLYYPEFVGKVKFVGHAEKLAYSTHASAQQIANIDIRLDMNLNLVLMNVAE